MGRLLEFDRGRLWLPLLLMAVGTMVIGATAHQAIAQDEAVVEEAVVEEAAGLEHDPRRYIASSGHDLGDDSRVSRDVDAGWVLPRGSWPDTREECGQHLHEELA